MTNEGDFPTRGINSGEQPVEAELYRIRWAMAVNPNTPAKILDELAETASTSLLERIAENPRTSPATLCRLALHEEVNVRAAVAENINTPEDVLWTLAGDEHPDVRYIIAENHHSPLSILERLSQDDNPYVAHRASRTMKRLDDTSAFVVGEFIYIETEEEDRHTGLG